MHLWLSLPTKVEIGAQRNDDWDGDVETTDGGYEVRNTRWAGPLSSFTASLPVKDVDDADLVALRDMWRLAQGKTHSFNFTDWVDGQVYRVRFDTGLQITTPRRMPMHHVDPFTLQEVRDVSPVPTVAPAITGTVSVGQVLTCSNGTWSGSPTSYAKQWTADGADIAGQTGGTYTVQSGDAGKLIGCYVTATDAYGGATRTWATEVGPVA
jgi:hypothetical protein